MSEHAGDRSAFDRIVLAAITANLGIVVVNLIYHDEMLETIDTAILWFFAVELTIRLAMGRRGFFRSRWNIADAIIIVASLLPIAGSGIALLRLARVARSFHLMRHVTHLRVYRWCVDWNNRPRAWLELKVRDGWIRPTCFYCEDEVRWRDARINMFGWRIYGRCCGESVTKAA